MNIEQIIENHVCRFNDAPQRCECYIAGLKEILEGVKKIEKSKFKKESIEVKQSGDWDLAIGWNESKSDTINHLESIINQLN